MKTTTKRISSLLASALMLFGALGSVACDDKGKPEPVYKNPEGLLLTTREAATEFLIHDFTPNSFFLFYSDIFTIPSLEKSIITLCPLSEKHFFLYNDIAGATDSTPTLSIPFPPIYYAISEQVKELNLPGCNKENVKNLAGIYYYLPEDGSYDFYFKIEDSSANIFFETSHYRYTIRTEDGYRYTTLTTIN